jgi:site-specific recombinase XerD
VAATRVGLVKPVSYHLLQHASLTHLPEDGYDIRTIEELLGHRDVKTTKTTMRYTYILTRGRQGVYSPIHRL